eukprot:TRINITY_DN28564_c0_g1_i1.p1 TRINITY_DN28564_c0_g1~~TRINITY_DN28564_c0_g1_i1.p1  ORF type:complete len:430 (+),score=82.76 TRINITY_DN28564_c0_g1_i1:155-1291(+)
MASEVSTYRSRVPVTAAMVAEHCLDGPVKEKDEDERIEAIFKLTHIRLENLSITDIDGIECITGKLTHLFLDSNKIANMGEIQWLDNLTTLVLSNNLIEEIDGIDELSSLQTLNLSNNKLKPFNVVDKIPSSVMIADFTGNDLLCQTDIRDSLLLHLQNPQKINGINCTVETVDEVSKEDDEPTLDKTSNSTLSFGDEMFTSEVDTMREILLSDYQKKVALRNKEVDRLLCADVDEVDEFAATEKIIEDHKKQRQTAAQRRENSELLMVARHKCKLASASLSDQFSQLKNDIRSRKMDILSRSADRREKLSTEGESKAFIKARSTLEKEQADLKSKSTSKAKKNNRQERTLQQWEQRWVNRKGFLDAVVLLSFSFFFE